MLVWAGLLAATAVGAAPAAGVPVVIGNDTVTFVQVRYDYPAAGQSTWYYTVVSGRKPAISHVTFGMPCGTMRILDAGMWDGEDPDARMSKAGMPVPGSFPAAPAGDPTTQLKGLKFDLGFEEGQTRHYYFTVNGNYVSYDMTVASKGGNGFDVGQVLGPKGDCSTQQPVLAALGDRVWLDQNDNGLQDGGEPGVADVVVHLLDSDGDLLQTQSTGADGYYLFTNLVDGVYSVRFERPEGYFFTVALAGDVALDSNADPITGQTAAVVLPAGTTNLTVDAGLVLTTAGIRLTKTGTYIPGTRDPWQTCTVFGPAGVFNALILGNFQASGGDTDGRLGVGGNAVVTTGYSVGQVIAGHAIPEIFGGKVDMFIVGGDLEDGVWGVNGNIVYGGERTGPVRYMVNGNLLRKVTPVTINEEGNVPAGGGGLSFDDFRTALEARSAQLGALADRGVVTRDTTQPYRIELVGDDPRLNVFNLTAEQWSVSSSTIYITAPEGSTVLVNIHGSEVVIRNSAIELAGVDKEHVLYNYVDATRVATSAFTHEGSVLAVHADGEFAGGSIDGRAVFGGNVVTGTGFEFHNFHFNGRICFHDGPPPVPPSIVYEFTVENTGNVPLANVMVSDPLVQVGGGPIMLAPGATDATSFTATYVLTEEDLAAGTVTNTATAIGFDLGGGAVTDDDTEVVNFEPVVEEEEEDPGTPGGGGEPPAEWMKPDFVVQSVELPSSPTVSGARFSAIVRVTNAGYLAGDGGTLAFWAASPSYTELPAVPDRTVAIGTLAVGETREFRFDGLRAPSVRGTYHAMAVADRASAAAEMSEGNNHGGATYSIEPVVVEVTPGAGGNTISWNSAPGYYYFVERTTALDQPFTDIADNLEATPPVNEFVDATPPEGTVLYRVWGYKP